MNNAKKIYNIGQWIMVLGSLLYIVELVWLETKALTIGILCIYAVALVMMLIGYIGTAEERKAEKEAKKKAA